MEFYEEDNYIISKWNPRNDFQGWINTLHGGIQSTLADEISSWVIFRKYQTGGFTSKLEIRFKKNISTTDGEITLKANVIDKKRNMVFVNVDIFDHNNELCTQATVVYSIMEPQVAHDLLQFRGCLCEDEK